MLTRKTVGIAAVAFVVVGLLLAGPSYSQVSDGAQQVVDTAGSDTTVVEALVENLANHEDEQDYVWEDSDVNEIVLSNAGIVISGNGAVADGNMVAILAAGTYRFRGTLTDGQIFVNSSEEGLVRLILNGIWLHCSSSAPIFIKNVDKAILVLAEDANNYVADEAVRTVGDSEEDDPNAAIFSKENLTICGAGTLTVDANYADGMDINGSVVMTGGTLLVNGPTTNDNGALDYDSAFKITGGFLVAAGSSGMAQAPGTTSTQYSVLATLPSTCQAGALFRIQARDGTDILTFAPAVRYQSVAFSSPKLQKGTTYDVYYGGSSTGTPVDGLYEGGVYTAGTKYASFTISSVTTNVVGGGSGGAPGDSSRNGFSCRAAEGIPDARELPHTPRNAEPCLWKNPDRWHGHPERRPVRGVPVRAYSQGEGREHLTASLQTGFATSKVSPCNRVSIARRFAQTHGTGCD